MKKLFTLFFLLLPTVCFAQAPVAYYSGTSGFSGYALKAKLHKIISSKTTSWNYGDLPYFYESTDRDLYYENDSTVLDIYGENPSGPDPYNYTYSPGSLISGAAIEGLGYNREHVFSQSQFNSEYPMYSDLHFIVPADARVNQRRSNYPYANAVASPAFTSLNGTKVGLSATPGYALTVTEPIAEFKGEVARMLLYVAIRYQTILHLFEYDNARNPFDGTEEKALEQWYINLLLSWNHADPPSAHEIDRNNKVFAIQGNRNPLIDHPEWADSIWHPRPIDSDAPSFVFTPTSTQKGAHFVSIKWLPVPDPDVLGYVVSLDGVDQLVSAGLNFTADGLLASSPHTFTVRAYDQSYNYGIESGAVSITTLAADSFSSDLYFTKAIQYDNLKALEIYNNTGHEVDLRTYRINVRQYNAMSDDLYWSTNPIRLENTVAQGERITVIMPQTDTIGCFDKNTATIISAATPLVANGLLAVDLRHNERTIDRLGNAYAYADFLVDKTLYRKASSTEPSGTYHAADWDVLPKYSCVGFGENPTRINGSISLKDKVKIYPNPVESQLRIDWAGNNAQDCNYKIVDLLGKRILEGRFQKNQTIIDVSLLKSGFYFMVIKASSRAGTTLKFWKK